MSDYGLNVAELVNEGQRLASGDKNFLDNFVRWPEGNGVLIVRFLPPAKKGTFGREKNPFYLTTRTHRLNGRSYHCPKEFDGKFWKIGRCPICDYYNDLWQRSKRKTPDEAAQMQSEARDIKPVERYYYNVLVRQQINASGEVEKNVGPKILSVGKTLHAYVIRAILGDETLQEAPLGDITHFATGRDFKIIKTMRQSDKVSFPNYSDSKFIDSSPLGDPQQIEQWLAGLHDLSALRKLMPYEELHRQVRVHIGLDKDEDVGFDPNEFTDEDQAVVAPVATVTKTNPAPVTKAAKSVEAEEVVVGGNSESLADDDFLSELQKINS
jgi:hypothetical protein